jgi:hypothetical protein
MSAAISKDGSLLCPAFKDFARRMGCRAGIADPYHCDGALEFHHWPPKGSSGVTRDDHGFCLCHSHHEQAQKYIVPRERQDAWVNETRSRFMDQATEHEWKEYNAARKRWIESRVFVEAVEW